MPLSVIEFQDPTGEIMVARVPQEGTAEFLTSSQLIVQDGQIAVFYRDGRPTDAFRAGRYTLDTKNLPVLGKLINLVAYGGKSPFRAYVYFIQLKTFTTLGWGTPTPILFRDSEFRAVHLRAHGSFSLRVGAPSTFLQTLVGSQGLETTYAIQEFVRRVVVSRFAKVLPSILKTVLDLPAHYQEIETGLKQAVHDDLNQYGIELVDLLVEAITVPPEVQQMIDRAAGTRALDESELRRYQTVAMSDALRDASKQPGTAGMAEAIGLGAGIGMAKEFVRPLAAGAPGAAPPGVPPPLPTMVQWYVAVGGKQAGPFSASDVVAQIQARQITRDTLVWHEGMANWAAAGQVADLASFFSAGPPPLPPTP